MLFVVYWVLRDVWCLLCVSCCVLVSVDCCFMRVVMLFFVLRVVFCVFVYRVVCIACCMLYVAWYFLFDVCCVLFVVC